MLPYAHICIERAQFSDVTYTKRNGTLNIRDARIVGRFADFHNRHWPVVKCNSRDCSS